MLKPLADEKRKEMLPWVYFIGAGYFPTTEDFTLGKEPGHEYFIKDIFSSKTLETEVNRLSKPTGWLLIFFVVTNNGRKMVTKEDAIWFLDNRDGY